MKRLSLLAILCMVLLGGCVTTGGRGGSMNIEPPAMVVCLGMTCRVINLPVGTENFLTWEPATQTRIFQSDLGVIVENTYTRTIEINGVPVGTEIYALVLSLSLYGGAPDKLSPLVLVHAVKTAATGEPVEFTRAYIFSDLNTVEVRLEIAQGYVAKTIEKFRGHSA